MNKSAQDKSALIGMLNKAFEKENKAFRGYIYAAVTVTGPLHDVYEKLYKEFADREREHIYEVGEKITALGGKVSTECLPIDDIADAVSKGYDAVLLAQQNAETETLKMYMEIHTYAGEIGDIPTVLLIEHILQEEQEHHDELQRILMDVPGKNNVEKHDELVVDAFVIRRQKLADLTALPEVKNEADMNKYAIRWFKVNKEIVKLLNQMGIDEDDVGVIDYDDEAYPQLLRDLMKQRDILQSKLGDFDMKWLVRYMEDGSDEGKKAKDTFAARKVKLAGLFVVAEDKALFDTLAARLKELSDRAYVAMQSGDKRKHAEAMNGIKDVMDEITQAISANKLTREDRVKLWNTMSDEPESIYDSGEEIPEPPRVNSITQTKAKTPEEAYKAYKLYMKETFDQAVKDDVSTDLDWLWIEERGLEDAINLCSYPKDSPQYKKWEDAIMKYHRMEKKAIRKLSDSFDRLSKEEQAKNRKLLYTYRDQIDAWFPPAHLDTNFVWGMDKKRNNVDDTIDLRAHKLASLFNVPNEDKFVMRQSKIATLFYDELLKLKDERRKVTEEIEKIIADLKQDPNFGTENMAPRPKEEGDRLDRLGKREWQLRQQIMELEKAKQPNVMSDKRDITDANMDSYIKKWIKLNKEMRSMEDGFGIEDEEDSAPPEYKGLARERKEIKEALDNFDDHWMRDYFGGEEPMDEVEPVMTMRDYK